MRVESDKEEDEEEEDDDDEAGPDEYEALPALKLAADPFLRRYVVEAIKEHLVEEDVRTHWPILSSYEATDNSYRRERFSTKSSGRVMRKTVI